MNVNPSEEFGGPFFDPYAHSPAEMLPVGSIPYSLEAVSIDVPWYSTDSEARYRTAGHPFYSERDIRYRLNSHGYRAPELDLTTDLRVLSVGCSCTFGVGVPEEARYSTVFTQRLRDELDCSALDWNMGLPGRSLDYCARVTHLTAPVLDPDIVLMLAPPRGRREYLAKSGLKLDHMAWFGGVNQEAQDLSKTCTNLASLTQDNLNIFHNYSSMAALLRDREFFVAFYQGGTEETDPGPVSVHLDWKHWSSEFRGVRIDNGRDSDHPGPGTHHWIANLFWQKFVDTGGFERITRKLAAKRLPRSG